MSPRTTGHRGGFTLIELLLAMGIIAVLAAILLPTLAAVSTNARITATQSLIRRLDISLVAFKRDLGTYPPDYLPKNAQLRGFLPADAWTWVPKDLDQTGAATAVMPPETLYYFLAHSFLTGNSPYITLSKGREYTDCNTNGLPEVVDSWGRPILYNAPSFPDGFYGKTPFPAGSGFNYAFNPFTQADGYIHKVGVYDLFSVGPDAKVGISATDLTSATYDPKDTTTLANFCQATIGQASAGQGDDICNWKRQ